MGEYKNFILRMEELKNSKFPSIEKMEQNNNFEKGLQDLTESINILRNSIFNSKRRIITNNKDKNKIKFNNRNKIRKSIFTMHQDTIYPFRRYSKMINSLSTEESPKNYSPKSKHNNITNKENKKIVSFSDFTLPIVEEYSSNKKNLNSINSLNSTKTENPIKLKKNFSDSIFDDIYISGINKKYISKDINNNKIKKFPQINIKSNFTNYALNTLTKSNELPMINKYKFKLNLAIKKSNINNKDLINKGFNGKDTLKTLTNKSIDISKDNEINKERNKNQLYHSLSSSIIKDNMKNIPKLLINRVKELRIKNLKLNKKINNCKNKFEEMNFHVGSKLKYSKWKYQISDFHKYFIDIENFGEREREEIERRKTFYDILEDTVDDINEKNIQKKFALPSERKKLTEHIKKNDVFENKKRNLPYSDKLILKQKRLEKSLEKIIKRKYKEKKKRNEINNILEKSFIEIKEVMKI